MKIKLRHGFLVLLVIGCLCLRPALAETSAAHSSLSQPVDVQLEQQGQALYESGQSSAAVPVLEQAVQIYRHQGDRLREALTLSNLALVYQSLGQWNEANRSIAASLDLLKVSVEKEYIHVLAQALNIQGRLQLAQGQTEAALSSWEQAAIIYQQEGNASGELQSRLNQAQALQDLGLYQRAITLLTDLSSREAPLLVKATVLRSLGDALQVAGDLAKSRQALEQALQILTAISDASAQEAIAATQLSLANLTRIEATTQLDLSALSPTEAVQILTAPPPRTLAETALRQRQTTAAQQFVQQIETALQLYQQAANQAATPSTRVQAQLNQLSALLELQRWSEAASLVAILQPQLDVLPIDQTSINQRINLALASIKLEQAGGTNNQTHSMAFQLLTAATQQAIQLKDLRAQSFALGSLGALYEQIQQATTAKQTTEQALMLAQSINATDLSYRWQWQLGRLLEKQGNRDSAIAAYAEAVKSLQALRKDLAASNREVQFSFQAQVEPVYRELVDLLLAPQANSDIGLAQLIQAREVIEGLQIAELDNFFREACLETQFQIDRVVDQANLSAAIFYTIALPDRLEVVLKLPQQDLVRYTTPVQQSVVDAAVNEFLDEVKRPYISQRSQALSRQIYDWLIRPADAWLNDRQIETLVFVLDGALRNLPVAALSDGQQFLIEKYGVALAPGLQLTNPKPLQQRRFNVLVAGLSEARANFAPLNFVAQEIQEIQTEVPSKVLFNQSFTEANLQKQLDTSTFSIVHIATHGQFSSNAADTFILAWDRPINVNELSSLLQAEEVSSPEPIELLVLSACRTAAGDRRAALGMAGVAVRAGARSTIASLWNLDDDSGAVLMEQFYQTLAQNAVSKAEALRHAQRSLLENPQYAAPRFWAPYVLLGNWL